MNTINGFFDMRFPEDIACGSIGGPEYFTDIVTTAGGYEQRNINWSQARRRFRIMHGVKNDQQFKELLSFFHNCRGRGVGFRFKDWSDYKAKKQLIGIGNGAQKEFQLCKQYTSKTLDKQEIIIQRYITKPVESTVFIYTERNNGVNEDDIGGKMHKQNLRGSTNRESEVNKQITKKEGGTDEANINIDYSNGTIKFLIPPPIETKIFADFEFDIPARFDNDRLPSTLEGQDLHSINDISIVELK